MTRKRLTERQVISVLLQQKAVICCYRCRIAFKASDIKTIEREHLHELGLGGLDELDNMAYSHGACHRIITDGTGATTAGSSKNRIAKVKRLRGEMKPRVKQKIKTRASYLSSWPPGRKISSRKFN